MKKWMVLACAATTFAAPASAEEVKPYPCYNYQGNVACGHFISDTQVKAEFVFSLKGSSPEALAWHRSIPDLQVFTCELRRNGLKKVALKGCHRR